MHIFLTGLDPTRNSDLDPYPIKRAVRREVAKLEAFGGEPAMAIWVSLISLLSALLSILVFSVGVAVISGRRSRRRAVGFFHPFTNDGGGGERVLWCAVRAVQEERSDLDCAVYTGDEASPESLAARALDRFGVRLLRPLIVCPCPFLSSLSFFLCFFFNLKIWI